MFLIFIDAYSKWIDVHIINSATASVTIEKMKNTFATFGIPLIDNASNFTMSEEFMKSHGIHHVRAAPYYATSNDLTECAV